MFRSIRLRLALSFAGIALIAAVALGAVLLVTLQRYYSKAESDYLATNAKAISGVVMKMVLSPAPHDELQVQIDNLAFLSQTRVRVYDGNKQLTYDSGVPQKVSVALDNPKGNLSDAEIAKLKESRVLINIDTTGTSSGMLVDKSIDPATGSPPKDVTFRYIQVIGSPFGFYLNADVPIGGPRSTESVTAPVVDPNGKDIGSVVLSDGPALGSEILRRVAFGWAVASAVAVLFAAGVGWFISRRISAPILALTATTDRMAAGDLSSRAAMNNQDEFGHLARSFNQMADQVEGTIATLRRFVSDAAHELQTPVTALRTNLDLVADDQNAQERALFLQRAQATVKRLEELNNNLLDLSRLEANGAAAQETTIDLVELLVQQNEFYASQAEQAGLIYQAETPPAPVLIRGDASQISRAIHNLIDNACKFTPPGGTVRIRLQQTENRVTLSVADSGIGIPPEDLPQLFNRFHRGRNATAYAGSGLGLAIVKAIMDQQGGQITATNLNPGACFTLAWKI